MTANRVYVVLVEVWEEDVENPTVFSRDVLAPDVDEAKQVALVMVGKQADLVLPGWSNSNVSNVYGPYTPPETVNLLVLALRWLTRFVTSDEDRYRSRNPYGRPAVVRALKALAFWQGKDPEDFESYIVANDDVTWESYPYLSEKEEDTFRA